MAELGNLLNVPQSESKFEVEVDMLDYSYVGECTDPSKLSAILDVLKSGKEGLYPDVSSS